MFSGDVLVAAQEAAQRLPKLRGVLGLVTLGHGRRPHHPIRPSHRSRIFGCANRWLQLPTTPPAAPTATTSHAASASHIAHSPMSVSTGVASASPKT